MTKRIIDNKFWSNKRIFITGHTGFKGAWLCLWLHSLGATVQGYALDPPTAPNLFELCNLGNLISSKIADIRDLNQLTNTIKSFKPDIVFHLAAQSLVKESYQNPLDTYEINVIGTLKLFEAVRNSSTVKSIINVTSDKCYDNKEWWWGYREIDPMGGHDPYSSSKGCAELLSKCYWRSFFENNGIGLASCRAGNVIGGGDWASNRLIPDIMKAFLRDEKLLIRNPSAIRPWQYVLEPLGGYLLLAQKLYQDHGKYSGGWNFGPNDDDVKTVKWIVDRLCHKWKVKVFYELDRKKHPHEAQFLKLDCSKARSGLGWRPRWNIEQALDKVVEWFVAYREKQDLLQLSLSQINTYSKWNSEV